MNNVYTLFSRAQLRVIHNIYKYASVLDANIRNKHRKRLFGANYRKKMYSVNAAVPFDATLSRLAEQARN